MWKERTDRFLFNGRCSIPPKVPPISSLDLFVKSLLTYMRCSFHCQGIWATNFSVVCEVSRHHCRISHVTVKQNLQTIFKLVDIVREVISLAGRIPRGNNASGTECFPEELGMEGSGRWRLNLRECGTQIQHHFAGNVRSQANTSSTILLRSLYTNLFLWSRAVQNNPINQSICVSFVDYYNEVYTGGFYMD